LFGFVVEELSGAFGLDFRGFGFGFEIKGA
jgi:hypothetical protein